MSNLLSWFLMVPFKSDKCEIHVLPWRNVNALYCQGIVKKLLLSACIELCVSLVYYVFQLFEGDRNAYMPTVQIKEEHSSFWEKIIIILMQVFLFLYKFVCSIE